ncbi:MAG: hypothetical protein ABUT20_65560, partial [Bacteroidota bacterium]
MKSLFIIYIMANICVAAHGQFIPAIIFSQPLFTPDTSSLPLHNLTVTEKDKKALLRWKADTMPAPESFYAV